MRIYRHMENVSTTLSGMILLGLTFIGMADVIAPWLGYPLTFITELSQVGLATCIFLALPRVQSTMSNITIDMLMERLTPTRRDFAYRAQYFVVAVLLAGLGYLMVSVAISSYYDGEYTPGSAQISLWPFKALAAFGVCLASVGALTIVFRRRAGTKHD